MMLHVSRKILSSFDSFLNARNSHFSEYIIGRRHEARSCQIRSLCNMRLPRYYISLFYAIDCRWGKILFIILFIIPQSLLFTFLLSFILWDRHVASRLSYLIFLASMIFRSLRSTPKLTLIFSHIM